MRVALPDNLPADLVARRADIVAARWQVEAAMHDVKEAKAEFFPDVNLAAAFGFDAFGWGRFLQASSRQMQFGPAIHLPIFDAGALRSQLKSRYADFDAGRRELQPDARSTRLSDVATQVSSIRSIDQQIGSTHERALDASTKAYELAVIRYKAGLVAATAGADRRPEPRSPTEQTVTNAEDAPPRPADRRSSRRWAAGSTRRKPGTRGAWPTDRSKQPRRPPRQAPAAPRPPPRPRLRQRATAPTQPIDSNRPHTNIRINDDVRENPEHINEHPPTARG